MIKDLKMSIVAAAPPYSECAVEETSNLGRCKSHRRLSDVYLLFNQQRLDKLTQQQFADYLSENFSTDSLSELRSKLTDEQIFKGMKSRYCQTKSELRDYMNYLRSISQSEREMADFKRRQKEEEDRLKHKDEPKPE